MTFLYSSLTTNLFYPQKFHMTFFSRFLQSFKFPLIGKSYTFLPISIVPVTNVKINLKVHVGS